MASTTFIDRATNIQASWLNDVNTAVFATAKNLKLNGAIGNGVVDDTARIQSVFASGGVILIPTGTFLCSNDIQCVANTVIIGLGGTLKFTNGNLRMAANVVAYNIKIDGNNKTNADHGIFLPASATNVFLDTPTITNVHYNGIDNSVGNSGLTVINPNINGTGGAGISVTSQGFGIYNTGSSFRVQGGEIQNTFGQAGVGIFGGTVYQIENMYIHDTFFRGITTFGTPSRGLISGNTIQRTGQLNNTGSGVGCNGIFNPGDPKCLIIGNTIEDVAENGIEGNGIILSNNIRNTGYLGLTTPSKEGIYVDTSAHVQGNHIHTTVGSGIGAFISTSGTNQTIKDNIITNPGGTGISIQIDGIGITSGEMTVNNNTIYGANAPGQMGVNIFRSNSAVFDLTKSEVSFNTVFGRTSNFTSTFVGKVRGNSFDPTVLTFGDAQAQALKSTVFTAICNQPLTATRNVITNTANPETGDRLKVIRTTASTGASNLTIGSPNLKSLATGQWAEAEYDGTAWVLIAFGSL